MKVKTPAREIIKPYVEKGLSIQEIVDMTGLKYTTVQVARRKMLGSPDKKRSTKRKKGWNKDRHACRTCKWRGNTYGKNKCDYIILTRPNHSRGCSVEDCDKYIRGPRVIDNSSVHRN